jgi:hypothetical protein
MDDVVLDAFVDEVEKIALNLGGIGQSLKSGWQGMSPGAKAGLIGAGAGAVGAGGLYLGARHMAGGGMMDKAMKSPLGQAAQKIPGIGEGLQNLQQQQQRKKMLGAAKWGLGGAALLGGTALAGGLAGSALKRRFGG